MNPAKFDSLSASNQAALMRASGENFARIAGRGWDKHDALGQAAMDDAGIATITADANFIAEIKAATGHLESDWVATANSLGVDGAAVMADLRAEIAKVAAE